MKLYRYNEIEAHNPFDKKDWRRYFFEYMCTREGFLLTVYRDIYGYYTVGIGHVINSTDTIPKQEGFVISKQDVIDLFIKDFKMLRIEFYTNEIYNATPVKKIGLASFIWGHGTAYRNASLRKVVTKTESESAIRSKVASWDRNKPANYKRNRADFDMFFTGLSNLTSGNLDFTNIPGNKKSGDDLSYDYSFKNYTYN